MATTTREHTTTTVAHPPIIGSGSTNNTTNTNDYNTNTTGYNNTAGTTGTGVGSSLFGSGTSSSTTTNSNPVLDVKETGHRMAEGAETHMNNIKRATIGGSELGDKVSEAVHQASNRLTEVRERMADNWNKTVGGQAAATNTAAVGANSDTPPIINNTTGTTRTA